MCNRTVNLLLSSNEEVVLDMLSSDRGFPSGSAVKEPAYNARDAGDSGSILGSERSPGGGNGNPLWYSCL